jgi:hypothetical protein
MTGMAHMQVTDMYMQLREAFELLGSDEVTGQLSMGRRRGVWATIDKLHREELGSAPDIASVRALAVEGNRVFQWIADFDPSLGDGRFEEFRDAAEAWIIAASTVGEAMPAAGGEPEEEEEEDDFGGFDAEEGEEEEW